MLSKKAKQTIQTLMHLGKQKTDVLLSASQIASNLNIPKKSMESILFDLKNATLIFSKKGVQGGYFLIRPLETIYMEEIVRLIDGPIAQVTCASVYHYRRCDECTDEATCAIRKVYLNIREANLKILSVTSIAHLVAIEQNEVSLADQPDRSIA